MSTLGASATIPSARPRRSPRTLVLAVAVPVIVLETILRLVVKARGWFAGDDILFIGRASTMRTWSSDYLMQTWHGHVMPGSFVEVAAVTALAPWEHWPVVVVGTIEYVVTLVLVLVLLVELCGWRLGVLVPFTLYAATAGTLPAFAWWAAALNQMPGQIAMLLLWLAVVKAARAGGRRRLVWAGVATLAVAWGLLYSEKVALSVPCALVLALLVTPGPWRARLRPALTVLAGVLVVAGAYTLYYLVGAEGPSRRGSSVGLVGRVLRRTLLDSLLPSLVGGPLRWDTAVGYATPPLALVLVAGALVLAVVVLALRSRPRVALLCLATTLGYALVNALLLGTTRATYVGDVIGAEGRYTTDVVVTAIVFLSVAALGLREPARGTGTGTGPGTGRGAAAPAPRPGLPARAEGPLTAALCALVLVVGLISTVGYASFWHRQPMRAYVEGVRTSYALADGPVDVLDLRLPESATGNLFGEMVYPSVVFADLRPPMRYVERGQGSSDLHMLTAQGELARVTLGGGVDMVPGPDGTCGYRVERARTIPLQATAPDYGTVVRLGYLAARPGTVAVRAGRASATVPVQQGLHYLYLVSAGAVRSITVTPRTPGLDLCVANGRVGLPVPEAGTQP